MGGGDAGSQTTEVNPWKGAEPYLRQALGGLNEQFLKSLGQDWTQQRAGMTPEQLASIDALRSYYSPGGQYDTLTGQATDAWGQALRSPEQVAQSQEVQNMIAAMTNPMMTSLREDVMPTIRSGAGAAGQYGSTRQGVAEGLATGKTQQAIGDVTGKVVGDIYTQQLNNQMRALGLSPMMTELGAGGARGLAGLGEFLRGEEQADIDLAQWNATQAGMAPYMQYLQTIMPTAGLGSTQTTTMEKPGLGMGQRLGGAAATGLGAYSTLAAAGSAAAGPVGWMAGLAALLASQ